MSNVETFKYYASQLNLTKPQLEAVTDCFKACFEADANGDVEPSVTKMPKNVGVAKKYTHFEDPNAGYNPANLNQLLDQMPDNLKNMVAGRKNGSELSADIQQDFASMPGHIVGNNQEGMKVQLDRLREHLDEEGARQQAEEQKEAEAERQRLEANRRKIMERQKFLNRELGINLAIDGIWGKKSKAAYAEYLARKNGVKGKNRNPELARTAGPASSFDVTNVNSPLNQVAMGNRTPGQARTSGPAQQVASAPVQSSRVAMTPVNGAEQYQFDNWQANLPKMTPAKQSTQVASAPVNGAEQYQFDNWQANLPQQAPQTNCAKPTAQPKQQVRKQASTGGQFNRPASRLGSMRGNAVARQLGLDREVKLPQ